MEKIIVSTVVLSDWSKTGRIVCKPLTAEEFAQEIKTADKIINYCGHPATTDLLRESGLQIPPQKLVYEADGVTPKLNNFGKPQGAFWNGEGTAIAARPKAGVRGAAANGDTQVSSLDSLEFIMFSFQVS